MSTSLTERYIAAIIQDLPPDLHAEVHPELDALIQDAIEARMEQGEGREEAERAVLTDLGDPAVVFVLVAFAQVLAAGSVGDVLGAAIPATITATVHVFFWTTVVFALMERNDADTGITWVVD